MKSTVRRGLLIVCTTVSVAKFADAQPIPLLDPIATGPIPVEPHLLELPPPLFGPPIIAIEPEEPTVEENASSTDAITDSISDPETEEDYAEYIEENGCELCEQAKADDDAAITDEVDEENLESEDSIEGETPGDEAKDEEERVDETAPIFLAMPGAAAKQFETITKLSEAFDILYKLRLGSKEAELRAALKTAIETLPKERQERITKEIDALKTLDQIQVGLGVVYHYGEASKRKKIADEITRELYVVNVTLRRNVVGGPELTSLGRNPELAKALILFFEKYAEVRADTLKLFTDTAEELRAIGVAFKPGSDEAKRAFAAAARADELAERFGCLPELAGKVNNITMRVGNPPINCVDVKSWAQVDAMVKEMRSMQKDIEALTKEYSALKKLAGSTPN